MLNRTVSVAPMMEWTNRHYRYLARIISKHTLLYTEMVHFGAILRGHRERFLAYSDAEHPIALQLGGSDPNALGQCSKIAEDWGYDEVNLNVGCPSSKVQAGAFGACLMAEPQLVADCFKAMRDNCNLEVTVKTRLGIDDQDSYPELCQFVETVAKAGCTVFIMHARKAWLKGLNPKQNREIPPLRYDWVYRLKQEYPELTVILNGGITDIPDAVKHLSQCDGIMVGRAAYHDPYCLSVVDKLFYGDESVAPSLRETVEAYIIYCDQQIAQGVYLKHLIKPLLGLFQGVAGAKHWRRTLSEGSLPSSANTDVIVKALGYVEKGEFLYDDGYGAI